MDREEDRPRAAVQNEVGFWPINLQYSTRRPGPTQNQDQTGVEVQVADPVEQGGDLAEAAEAEGLVPVLRRSERPSRGVPPARFGH